ncbi:IS66 family insertion sequence element accessory protein TnpA [Marinobacter salarius]|uniref:IS66 family insertion sequence element accessory protein TnpA n=1 Tax=Marinobacter salarius TaxID=1420917 RepID=UPI003D9A565A
MVDQKRNSGLSAPKFCKQENIGYASFCNRRKRLFPQPKIRLGPVKPVFWISRR